jgi:adenylate cyclase
VDLEPWEAAGLYDADAPDAVERRELLEYLASLGLSVDDVADAAARRRIGQLAADKILFGDAGPTLTIRDIAARVDLPEPLVRRIVRAFGTADSDAPIFHEAHVQVFEAFTVGTQIFDEAATLQFSRTLGAATARVSEGAVGLFLSNVSPRLHARHATELERVRSAADAVRAFLLIPGLLDVLVRQQFVESIRRLGLLEVGDEGEVSMVVGFVDLVASTTLAHRVSSAELTRALGDFESLAIDAALAHDARVVKQIGDEVMLVAPDATRLSDVVLDLIDATRRHPILGDARGGAAAGEVAPRDGDYFGPVVNRAARLVGVATDGALYADDAVAAALARDRYDVVPLGPQPLKGFDDPVPVNRITRRHPS